METVFIDNVDIQDMGLILLKDHKHPLLPETVNYTVKIPGMHGEYDYGAELGARMFELPLGLKLQANRTELQKKIREITKILLYPNGKPRTVKLSFNYEPEKWYMVRYSGSLPIERLLTLGKFYLPLVAHDPFAYAESTAYDPTEPQQYDTGLQYDSGLMYPNTTTFDWQYTRHYTAVHNYSYYETPLKILINGHVINPRITNMTTGKAITINGEYSGLLVIDTKHFMIISSDSENEAYFLTPTQPIMDTNIQYKNELSRYNGDFFNLVEGTNELLFDCGLPNAKVSLVWNHRFM